jgi:hypothetical protein
MIEQGLHLAAAELGEELLVVLQDGVEAGGAGGGLCGLLAVLWGGLARLLREKGSGDGYCGGDESGDGVAHQSVPWVE